MVVFVSEKKDNIALILSLVQKDEALTEEHDTEKLMELTSEVHFIVVKREQPLSYSRDYRIGP